MTHTHIYHPPANHLNNFNKKIYKYTVQMHFSTILAISAKVRLKMFTVGLSITIYEY